jgi:hypothetical protein
MATINPLAINSPCLIWTKSLRNGYGNRRIKKRTVYVHRLACEEAHGPPPSPKHLALHRCGNRACYRGDHLYWGTRRDNFNDSIKEGTAQIGERSVLAKLTEKKVKSIRLSKLSSYALSKKMGVAASTIRGIRNGHGNWRWLA